MNIKFFLLDIDYITTESASAIVRLFGRTLDNKTVCCLDSTFKPYFYAVIKENSDISKAIEKIKCCKIEDSFVTNVVAERKNDLGMLKTVLKIFVNHPRDVPILSREIQELKDVEKTSESDILFIRRYLIDKNIAPASLCEASGSVINNETKQNYNVDILINAEQVNAAPEILSKLKALCFDIETYTSRDAYPNSRHDPVISAAFYGDDFQKVIAWKKVKTNLNAAFVKDEAQLILEFIKTIKDYKPDCLVGYFSDGFDFPYLLQRARMHGIGFDIGLDNSALKTSKRLNEQRITGIPHIDLFKFIKGIIGDSIKVENFGLNEVASALIGEKKLDFDIENIGELWDSNSNSINEILKYNLKDAELTYKLFNAVSHDILELVNLIGQPIDDVTRMHFGQLVEWYLIKKAKYSNVLIPNKPKFSERTERLAKTYQGAFVYQPKPGLYENIVVFDFKSLYPSIIIAHNIDPGSLASEKGDAFASPEIINESGKPTRCYFDKSHEGFIPSVLKDLIIRRNKVKEAIKKERKGNKLLEARSYMLKIIANAAYGMFGYPGARWYSLECAAAITAFGRDYILTAIDTAKKQGYEVVLSDTDSIAILLKDKTKDDALKFMNEINKSLPKFMELELEDFYKRGLFVTKKSEEKGAKKKYALINEKDELKIRGFETIRRDWSWLAKEVQLRVLEIILKESSPGNALEYVRQIIDYIKKKRIPIGRMVIRTQLRKELKSYDSIGPHVSVAKKMEKAGLPVGPGTIINYVITEGKGKIRDRAKLLEECRDDEYSAEYYINNQIIPAVKTIFEASGYTEEILRESKEQSKLSKFLGVEQ